MSSILGSIEKEVLKHVDLVGLAESEGVHEVAALIEPHAHLDGNESADSAKRLRDAADCLEADPPKIKEAAAECLQVLVDMVD